MGTLIQPYRFTAAGAVSWATAVAGLSQAPLWWSRLADTSTPFTDATAGGHNMTWGTGVTGNIAGATSDGDKSMTTGSSASTIANGTWMDGTSGCWTVAWVKTSGTGSERTAFSRYTNNTNFAWSLGVSSTNKAIYRIRTNVSFAVTGTSTITDGNWHLLVGTWDRTATNVKIYVDGTLEATTGSATSALSTGQAIQLGNGFTGAWTSGDGVDEAMFGAASTSVTLTSTDVTNLWTAR